MIQKKLQPIAVDAKKKARKLGNHEDETQSIQSKIDNLTANLDKTYMDRLTGLLVEAEKGGDTKRKLDQSRRPSKRTSAAIFSFYLHQS